MLVQQTRTPNQEKVDEAIHETMQQAESDGLPISYSADVGTKMSSGRGAMSLGETDLDSYLEATEYAKDLTEKLQNSTKVGFRVEIGGTVNNMTVLSTPWTNPDHISQFLHLPVSGVDGIDFSCSGYPIFL